MQYFKYYIPSVSLILMAVLIFAVPEILVAMISVFIMTMGVFILYIGHGLRKSEIELRKMDGWYRTSGWHRYCFYR
jgi:ABC-type nitrate/sulfonate/bicarbonate transport system permease component